MGTVRSRTWKGQRVWFIDYIAADGQRIRQTIGDGEENRRLAKVVLAQREAEAQLGIHRLRPSHTPRFSEFARDWLKRQTPRLKPKTYESYEDTLSHRLEPHFGEQRLSAISRRAIEDYLAHLHREGTRRGKKGKRVPLAPRTINKALMVLKMILKDAVDQGALESDPSARVKPVRHEGDDGADELHILQVEEIDCLLKAAEEPYRTLYLAAVHTGLRRGELLGLHWRDVDFPKGCLHVRRSLARIPEGDGYAVREASLKTRYSRRTIEGLSQALVDALMLLPAGDDEDRDYVFRSRAGGPLDPDNLDRAWKRHLTLAEIADRPFHSTRHTHASLLIAAGVHPKAIQARLGHASIATTLNTYGHLMPSAFEGVGERLEALLSTAAKSYTAVTSSRSG